LGYSPSLLRQSDYSLRCYLVDRVRGVRFRSRSLVRDGRATTVSFEAFVNESSVSEKEAGVQVPSKLIVIADEVIE
jgi:hypothetical protein